MVGWRSTLRAAVGAWGAWGAGAAGEEGCGSWALPAPADTAGAVWLPVRQLSDVLCIDVSCWRQRQRRTRQPASRQLATASKPLASRQHCGANTHHQEAVACPQVWLRPAHPVAAQVPVGVCPLPGVLHHEIVAGGVGWRAAAISDCVCMHAFTAREAEQLRFAASCLPAALEQAHRGDRAAARGHQRLVPGAM